MSAFSQRVAAGKVDPNSGVNQAVDQQIDEVLARINVTLQEKFGAGTLRAMLKGLEDFEDKLDEIDSGKELLATNNSGQPAAQLGGGSGSGSSSANPAPAGGSQPPTEQEALNVLMQSPILSGGIKNALRRILNPNDPQVIAVEHDGTPSDVASLRKELTDERNPARSGGLANRLKKAEDELDNVRDENKSGSLANQLKVAKQAQAAPATPADMVAKADVKAALKKIKEGEQELSTSFMSTSISNKEKLDEGITDLEQVIS